MQISITDHKNVYWKRCTLFNLICIRLVYLQDHVESLMLSVCIFRHNEHGRGYPRYKLYYDL